MVMKLFLFKSKSFTKALEGDPVILIHKGELIEGSLKKQRISLEEIEAAAREHGVESFKDVDLVCLR